jgi:hypothetical protein
MTEPIPMSDALNGTKGFALAVAEDAWLHKGRFKDFEYDWKWASWYAPYYYEKALVGYGERIVDHAARVVVGTALRVDYSEYEAFGLNRATRYMLVATNDKLGLVEVTSRTMALWRAKGISESEVAHWRDKKRPLPRLRSLLRNLLWRISA